MIAAFILKYITPRDYVIGGMGLVLIYSFTMWHDASVDLKKARLVYLHPSTQVVEKIVYKQGPVRIVTQIKDISGGKETIITEERGAVSNEILTSSSSAPISLAIAMREARSNRYLLTLGLNRLTPDFDGKALFVGYGFRNRFDIQVGGVEHNGFSPWFLTTVRF